MPTFTIMQTMKQIQAATVAARARLSDNQISTQVDCGKIQVVRVIPVKGKRPDIVPLSGWMPVSEAASYLQAM
jgi:hypothetical protein